jgi:RNA recognition motif-containing protein
MGDLHYGRPQYGRRQASSSPDRDGRRKGGVKRLRDRSPANRKEASKQQALANKEPTTLMLRNLPRPLTRDRLMDLLCEEGFGLVINFIYVPMNFQAGENFGYGFINLTTHEEAERVREKLQGFDRWPADMEWDKECDVGNGETCQGVDGHIERYRNSPVMHESVPEEHKPALYENGVRLPFPKNTKPIKKPHIRARKGKKGKEEGEEAAEEAAEIEET